MKTKNYFKLTSRVLIACLAIGISAGVTSCKKDDDKKDDPVVVDPGTIVVTENITANTTWSKDKIYQLAGRITVVDGVTLTIEPGTIIKGEAGTGANATALLIARGGKLMASGTATAPIIFTSVADEITKERVASGKFDSPNLDADINGLWGGLIVLGNAPISAKNSDASVQIEGIPTSDAKWIVWWY